MNFLELLSKAADKTGSQKELAERLGIDAPKISEWKKGKYKPSAEHIALLAEIAGLPVLQTLAEVQADGNPTAAGVWKRALETLKAAGMTALIFLVFGLTFPGQKAEAHQALTSTNGSFFNGTSYTLAQVKRTLTMLMVCVMSRLFGRSIFAGG